MSNWSSGGRIATVLSTSYPGCSAHRFTFSPQFLFCSISPRQRYRESPIDGLRTRYMLRLHSHKSQEIFCDGCGYHARPAGTFKHRMDSIVRRSLFPLAGFSSTRSMSCLNVLESHGGNGDGLRLAKCWTNLAPGMRTASRWDSFFGRCSSIAL